MVRLVMIHTNIMLACIFSVSCVVEWQQPYTETTERYAAAHDGVNDMASLSPPDGWDLVTGTWNTDVDREDTIVYSGIHSLHLINTTVAAKVRTPPMMMAASSLFGRTSATMPYGQWFYIRQDDDGNVLNTITVKRERYDATGTLLTTTTVFNSRVGSSGAWYVVGDDTTSNPNSPGYTRYTIEKAARAFDVYIDSAFGKQMPPWGVLFGDVDVSLTNDASYHTLTWPLSLGREVSLYGAFDGLVIQTPGVYSINAQLYGSAITNKLLWRLKLSAAALVFPTSPQYFYGPTMFGSNDHESHASINVAVPLGYNTVVSVEYSTGNTGAATISTGNVDYTEQQSWLTLTYIGR